MKFSIKNFFSKCDQSRSSLRIWSHLLKKSSTENFCAVFPTSANLATPLFPSFLHLPAFGHRNSYAVPMEPFFTFVATNHKSNVNQKSIQDYTKYTWWSVFAKIVNNIWPITIFAKSLHHRYLTRSYMSHWLCKSQQNSDLIWLK